MHFHSIASRPHWREQVQVCNYDVSLLENPPYWVEASERPFCAVFVKAEIDDCIAIATNVIVKLALQFIENVCNGENSERLFEALKIPDFYRDVIRKSWRRCDKSWYGRLDFAYDGTDIKLLEFNFDTPTSLYESALLQRLWLEDLRERGDVPRNATESNQIEEMLVQSSLRLANSLTPTSQILHLGTFERAKEETETVKYLQSCADKAGLQTKFIFLDDLQFTTDGQLLDGDSEPITHLFKLFPWELLIRGDGDALKSAGHPWFASLVESNKTKFFEPSWKAILSNKAALPLLWQMAPECKYLLESYFEDDAVAVQRLASDIHVRKPIFGCQGGGITIVTPEGETESVPHPDKFGDEGFIIQSFAKLPIYDEHHLVLGAWVIGGEFAGINLRADRHRITSRQALFIPHYVV